VDTPRVGYHRDVLHHPIGARTVELALAPESPRVNCRITPVADICRDRPCLTERLREGATGSTEARTGSRAERTGLPPPLEPISDLQIPPTRHNFSTQYHGRLRHGSR